MSSRLRVVALISAFNEADIIGAVIDHLIRQDISVYLIDDGSSDATVEVARAFLDRGLVGLETLARAERSSFDWSDILRRKEVLASTVDADWFIHHDADEFREAPWAGLTLASAIEVVDGLGYNAIDFRVFNFPPTSNAFAHGESIENAFRYFEAGDRHDRLQIKCWKRTGLVDLVGSAGHRVAFPGQRVFPIPFLLRHYPVRSQQQGEQKVFRDRQPRFVDRERNQGWHVQYDDLRPGHNFIRDPAGLTFYDAALVRANLALTDRTLLSLDDERADRERLRAENARLTDVEDQLRREVALRLATGAALARAEKRNAEQRRQSEAERSETAQRIDTLVRELDETRLGAERTGREVRALRGSRSWRITAPLRWVGALALGTAASTPPQIDSLSSSSPALDSLRPVSAAWGMDRGQPIDRYYIGRFLAAHAADVRGRVLEVKDSGYTRRIGLDRVSEAWVLDIDASNPDATIVADLAGQTPLPEGTCDCVILTQTLHLIFDVPAALRRVSSLLKPDGILLASLPAISRISLEDEAHGARDCWRFTRAALERLFGREFALEDLQVETFGNVRTCAAFLYGLSAEDLSSADLAFHDPLFPLIHCVRAIHRP